jgi:ankyrin repeat protein
MRGTKIVSLAAKNGHLEVVKLLLERGAIIDSKTNVTLCSVAISSFGPSPLRWEASYWLTGFG